MSQEKKIDLFRINKFQKPKTMAKKAKKKASKKKKKSSKRRK